MSRNRFCDFLADPDSRSFSRFGSIIMQFAVKLQQQIKCVHFNGKLITADLPERLNCVRRFSSADYKYLDTEGAALGARTAVSFCGSFSYEH